MPSTKAPAPFYGGQKVMYLHEGKKVQVSVVEDWEGDEVCILFQGREVWVKRTTLSLK